MNSDNPIIASSEENSTAVDTNVGNFLQILHPTGVFEVRALDVKSHPDSNFTSPHSGYFKADRFDSAAAAIDVLDASGLAAAIYVTVNPVDPALVARANHWMKAKAKNTTTDQEVIKRTRLLLDIDPVRFAGISSTNEEMNSALDLASGMQAALTAEGWPEPMAGMSGNGAYLIFAIDLPNDDDITDLIKGVLHGLAARFDTDAAKIDKSTFNAARIMKMLGTTPHKGDSTNDRPHRQSWFRPPSGDLQPVSRLQLESVAVKPQTKSTAAKTTTNCNSNTNNIGPASSPKERCRSYLEKIPDAIQGNHGSDRLFQAACICVKFDLADIDALEVLHWYSVTKSQPPWTDEEIHHKLKDAAEKVEAAGERGSMLQRTPTKNGTGRHTASVSDMPQVLLPGGSSRLIDAAGKFGQLMADAGHFYRRGEAIISVETDPLDGTILKPIKIPSFPSHFEQVAALVRRDDDGEIYSVTCDEKTARLIAHCPAFLEPLQKIRLLTKCPVLIERNGQLIVISGYDMETGILAEGEPPENVALPRAKELLAEVISEFNFTTPSDRSRALAAMITPAMIFGGLLRGHAPVDLGEADDSQAGKGFRNKLTAAIYGTTPKIVTQKKGGVGSLEESFNQALIRGSSIISFDNCRGLIDSPSIESFLTEDNYSARAPYSPDVEIDPRRIIIQLTSNRAEITRDLANRSSCVSIVKHDPAYKFKKYHEGNILDFVRMYQRFLLGAVFAVIRAWHAAGKPQTDANGHDFREWAQTLGWIVVNVLGAAPLLDGHRETQQRMASPVQNWLRDVAILIRRIGRLDCWLRASDLVDLLAGDPSIVVPGLEDHGDVTDEVIRGKVLRAIGRQLSLCFRQSDSITVDGLNITRNLSTDSENRKDSKAYLFTTVTTSGSVNGEVPDDAGGEGDQ